MNGTDDRLRAALTAFANDASLTPLFEGKVEAYVLLVDDVEALLALYQALPDDLMERMVGDNAEPKMALALAVLHGMYQWNKEHFTL